MRGRCIILRPDGALLETSISAPPPLDALQEAVGGNIEVVPYFATYEKRPCVAFCNEEGKLNGLPLNRAATRLWWEQSATRDVLVGSVVIIAGDAALLRSL